MPLFPFSQPPRPQPQWPLWILGATLLLLLVLACVYWVEPQGLRLWGSRSTAMSQGTHNFRCLENFELSLRDLPSALLIGRNGSGKSTMANALVPLPGSPG